jgi:hypothetical protein
MTAVAEGITHTQQGTLIITGAVDFALTAAPSIQNVTRGNAVTFTINLNETNDFINPVTLSVLGLPAGVTATFNPSSPVPPQRLFLQLQPLSALVHIISQSRNVYAIPIANSNNVASVWTASPWAQQAH